MKKDYILKVGDKVKVKPGILKKQAQKSYGTSEGIVTEIHIWEGELSVENHGAIHIDFNGLIDHYVYYEWEKTLKVIE